MILKSHSRISLFCFVNFHHFGFSASILVSTSRITTKMRTPKVVKTCRHLKMKLIRLTQIDFVMSPYSSQTTTAIRPTLSEMAISGRIHPVNEQSVNHKTHKMNSKMFRFLL